MKLRRVQIERFRGIRQLDWTLGGGFICLVGPGDSTKTTILDAVDLALSPRWNIPFDDSDFFDARVDEPIVISVTIGDLPQRHKSENAYGYLARGWSASGECHDEAEDGDELVLSVQLRVDSSLEPSWAVVNERNPEGRSISAKDRELLGCVRLGEFIDRHFSWGRGSVLSRLTAAPEGLSHVLAEAARAARGALADGPEKLANLRHASDAARRAGSEFGVAASSEYRPHLDVQAVSVGIGGLSLHDGEVPLRRAGLGTRRLLAVAIQREVARDGGITLIDEIEHGIEPHRVRRLVRVLRGCGGEPSSQRHVLMTTHSPVVLAELDVTEVRVVRSINGVTEVRQVDPAIQPILLKNSEAFLARKVLVCEGKTEIGLCRRLDEWWSENGLPSFGLSGVALADGGGRAAPNIARAFAQVGYDVALLGDSDVPLDPDAAALESMGVHVVLWGDGMALEERIVQDLPWHGVAEVVSLAMESYTEEGVRDAIRARLNRSTTDLAGLPDDWQALDLAEGSLRAAIGLAAKKHKAEKGREGWFKRVSLAQELASIVIRHFDAVVTLDLGRKICSLRGWAHGDG